MDRQIVENEPQYDVIKHPLLVEKNIRLIMVRLDQIHPVASGNKLYKLHYFLNEAQQLNKSILTFGGAYSNHLVAAAYASQQLNIRSTGIVRGERPDKLSHTLIHCEQYGMELKFISREEYKKINEKEYQQKLNVDYPEYYIIPEGGYHSLGARGAGLIMKSIAGLKADYIAVAVGTATTLAGLLSAATDSQIIAGFPVLKGMTDINERILNLNGSEKYSPELKILNEYHFGGYAKYDDQLIHFMNEFYTMHGIPLDFVYTAKMMFGVMDQIKKGLIADYSTIACLHTGGLQGNRSLPAGTLEYDVI